MSIQNDGLRQDGGAKFMEKIDLRSFLGSYFFKLLLACIALIVVLSFMSPYFLSVANFRDILLGASVKGIIALGITLVLITGDIDLSVGAVVAFASVILCVCINAGYPLPVSIFLTLAGAIAVGIVNGFFVSVLAINAFIITLGTMSVVRGLAYIVIGGKPVPFDNDLVRQVGVGSVLGVPIPIIFFAVVLVSLWFILTYTQFGRNIYAVGNSPETARLSGINVVKTKMLVFIIVAALAGVAGFLLSAQTYAGIPAAGTGYELDAITAAILGGTSLKGGSGRLSGTILGTLIVAIVLNGQNLLGIPYFYQLLSKGLIILLAMTISRSSK
ncbi:MAG: ABC transporter permease [Marinosulfonomonas sp.]